VGGFEWGGWGDWRRAFVNVNIDNDEDKLAIDS
jgi:hypothetical protein